MKFQKVVLTASMLAILYSVGAAPARAEGKSTTIKGYVIDSSCSFTKNLKKPISPECAVACAKGGSPLVIQTTDGVIYLPITGKQPASGQNDKLMPYAGEMVTVTGTVYLRGGAHAIVIDKIESATKQ